MEFLIIGIAMLPLAIWGIWATISARNIERKEEKQKAALGTTATV